MNIQLNNEQLIDHILLVDDEPDFELLIRQKFHNFIKCGRYILHFASNGAEALNILLENPHICIVITDINMPIMNGIELLVKINEMKLRTIKVVIISAYSDMINIRLAMNQGAFDFLTKPIDFNDLEKTIQKTIETVNFIKSSHELGSKIDNYQRELLAASEIQQAILPKTFPPFPDIKKFDIFGNMEPAELIGGDFFDFFLLDGSRIGLVIGDVSGHGLSAALFMAVARTIIHSLGKFELSPAACLSEANRFLCKESVDSMFVTVFYALFNYNTGELVYANAGHNYPFILNSNGCVSLIDYGSSIILGAFEDAKFTENKIILEKNSSLILYTDGVNEAVDINNMRIGTDVVMHFLSIFSDKNDPKNITNGIFNLVRQYSVNNKQTDDITVLTLSYYGDPE